MKLALVRLAIIKIMFGALVEFFINQTSIKVAAAENDYEVKDFSTIGLVPRIHGGQLAKEGQFPWQAGLLTNEKVYKVVLGPLRNYTFTVKYFKDTGLSSAGAAGATLISNRHLLTAAHVILKFNHTALNTRITKEIEVKLGTLNLYEGGIKFKTNKFIVHPEYNSYHALWPLNNDIAIIELSTSVSFTKFIYPVRLPVSSLIESETAILSGYGLCNPNTRPDGNLRYVRLRILPKQKQKQKCLDYSSFSIPENQLCSSDSVGACFGDSGGPLVMNIPRQDENGVWMNEYTLVGVMSGTGYSCTGPSIFIKVSSYMSFIRQNAHLMVTSFYVFPKNN